ncbi:MAG: O-antigen ligase family protein [Chloroflexota bacterium]|nr:O-antigen ligase family protein [Chloroflexota bacterium]
MSRRRGSQHVLRLFLWLALLLAVGLVAQAVVVTRQTRTRGVPSGFPAPVAGADVPILGVNVALEQYDDEEGEELEAALARIAEGGFVWVRQSFYRSQIEPEPGRFDWTVPDRVIAALARQPRLRLVAVLDDSPPIPPADPDRFAAFAGAFAARYGAQVDYYQVWDEPNLAAHWGGGPVNPPAYADLLARTAHAVRAADSDARILLAGLAPTVETGPQNLSDVRYLEQLYQAGAAPYFDVVSGKPYGFDTGPDDRRAPEDGTVLNFSRLLLLREVMVEQGDAGKAIWASHWGWNALPPGWTGAPSLWGQTGETTQAARTIAALERTRAEWPWVGALILEHFQPDAGPDDPRWGFALVGQDDAPRPVYDAVAAWATALPDGAPVGGYPALNPWATYEGDWRAGPLGADVGRSTALTAGSGGDRAIFRFAGSAVALMVRRGPYRAFLYVTVDGRPANALPRDDTGRAYVVLYDDIPTVATVPLATGLSPGPHTVEVLAEGGQGQWALVDWRVGSEPVADNFGWWMTGLAAAGLVLAALLIRDARRVEWRTLARIFLGWPEWAQVALLAGLTGVLWASAWVSWGHDLSLASCLPFPVFCLFLSLLVLPALAMLFALRPDLGLALVVFTAPFYLHPGVMLHRALSLPEVLVVLCTLGIAGLRIYASPNLRISPIDWAVLLLVLAAVVAGLAAADWRAAIFELRTVFLLPALYYGLLRLARLPERARWRVLDGWVLGAVGVALIGLVQYALGSNVSIAEGGLPRLQSVYYSPNNVGLYLERVWPLLVAVALWGGNLSPGRRGETYRRTLYGLALAVVTLALVLSFSRGALLLALPAALLVMVWRAGTWSRSPRPYRWAALALVVVGVLALIPLLRVPRFASMFDLQQGSTFFRLELWHSSLTLVREHPWFGVGPGNFLDAYRTRYVLPTAWEEFNLEHPHNVYLDHWTRLGLLGLLAGVAVQVSFWRTIFHRSQPSSPRASSGRPLHQRRLLAAWGAPVTGALSVFIGLAGSMAALLAHGLVDNTLFFPDLALIFFLTLALLAEERGAGG